MSGPRFVQISGGYGDLVALDEAGGVWRYVREQRHICRGDHYRHTCRFQYDSYWRPLTADRRDHAMWPPTPEELAEQEVEEALR